MPFTPKYPHYEFVSGKIGFYRVDYPILTVEISIISSNIDYW